MDRIHLHASAEKADLIFNIFCVLCLMYELSLMFNTDGIDNGYNTTLNNLVL